MAVASDHLCMTCKEVANNGFITLNSTHTSWVWKVLEVGGIYYNTLWPWKNPPSLKLCKTGLNRTTKKRSTGFRDWGRGNAKLARCRGDLSQGTCSRNFWTADSLKSPGKHITRGSAWSHLHTQRESAADHPTPVRWRFVALLSLGPSASMEPHWGVGTADRWGNGTEASCVLPSCPSLQTSECKWEKLELSF